MTMMHAVMFFLLSFVVVVVSYLVDYYLGYIQILSYAKKKFIWGLLLVLAKTAGGMELHHGHGMHMMMHVEFAAWLLMAAALTAKCLATIALSVLSQILHS
jgi:cbb3-type cytochrome oxidase subunit 1